MLKQTKDGFPLQLKKINDLVSPVTSVSFSFFFFNVLIDLKKRNQITISRRAATNLLPYILSRLPQLLMCGCSCCSSLAAASCFPSFLFLQITATYIAVCYTSDQNYFELTSRLSTRIVYSFFPFLTPWRVSLVLVLGVLL